MKQIALMGLMAALLAVGLYSCTSGADTTVDGGNVGQDAKTGGDEYKPDGGVVDVGLPDSGVVEDGGMDSGHPDVYQYECDMVVDLDASNIEGDWDAGTKVLVGTYATMGVNDKYAFFTTEKPDRQKNLIDVFSLESKKRVARILPCAEVYDSFASVGLSDVSVYWNRWGSSGREVFRWNAKIAGLPERLTYSNVGRLGSFEDSIVFGDIHIDEKTPETIHYMTLEGGAILTAQIGTEPLYGFQWEDWYIFQATYLKPQYKDCVASYNFGQRKYKEYACSNRMMITSGHSWKAVYQDWRDSSIYGHPSTDIFVYDMKAEKETRLTEDEASQWCPYIFKNLVVYKDLTESGVKAEGPQGRGGLWVHDLDTGAKRKVPVEPMDGCPFGVGDRYVVYNEGPSGNGPAYLIDLVNAGVVKDGHVVPE